MRQLENTHLWFDTFKEYDKFKNVLSVTVQDFEGFDEDWSEIYCDYDEDAIYTIEKELEKTCNEKVFDGWAHNYYVFADFTVVINYALENI